MFAKMLQRRWYPSLPCLLLLPFLVRSSESVAINKYYNVCSEHSRCGNQTVTFPFRLSQSPVYCGYPGYELNCSFGESGLTIELGSEEYFVKSINYEEGFLIVIASEFMENPCPKNFPNTSFNPALFNYAKFDLNLTVYLNCSFSKPPDLKAIPCLGIMNSYYKVDNGTSAFFENFRGGCSQTATIPVYGPSDQGNANWFNAALKEGFGLTWNHLAEWCQGCMNSGGICGYNEAQPVKQTCFCPNATSLDTCSFKAGKGSVIWKVVIGYMGGNDERKTFWRNGHWREAGKTRGKKEPSRGDQSISSHYNFFLHQGAGRARLEWRKSSSNIRTEKGGTSNGLARERG